MTFGIRSRLSLFLLRLRHYRALRIMENKCGACGNIDTETLCDGCPHYDTIRKIPEILWRA